MALVEGGFAVFYGLGGAGVIAPQTAGAVVAPLRMSVNYPDVVLRTYFGASAAGYAGVGASEFFGIYSVLQEQGIDYRCLQARPRAEGYVGNVFTAFHLCGYLVDTSRSGGKFLAFYLLLVHVETGKQHIYVRHDDAPQRREFQTGGGKFATQYGRSVSSLVATGHDAPDIGALPYRGIAQTVDEMYDRLRQSPRVNREDETYLPARRIRQILAHGDSFSAEPRSKFSCNIAGVSRSGEVINHGFGLAVNNL